MERLIREAGFTPARRRQDYSIVPIAADRRCVAAAPRFAPSGKRLRAAPSYDQNRHRIRLAPLRPPRTDDPRRGDHRERRPTAPATPTVTPWPTPSPTPCSVRRRSATSARCTRTTIRPTRIATRSRCCGPRCAGFMPSGWRVQQVDITVVAEYPRIGPHRDAMRECLADALGVGTGDVSIKGKSNEGMGWIGRGEGLACSPPPASSPRT